MSGYKLSSISSLFFDFFPKGWADKIDWATEGQNQAVENIVKKIAQYEREVLLRIGYSMLSGEYIVKSNIKQILNEILDDLSIDSPSETGVTLRDKLEITIQRVLGYTVYSIKRYKHFIETIYNQYSSNEPILALNAYRINEDVTHFSEWNYLYDILFYVVEFDHRLSYNKRKLNDLILHYSRLDDDLKRSIIPAELVIMISALKEKCFFLLKKLLIYDKAGLDYMVDFELKHVGVEDSSPVWLKDLDEAFEFYRKQDTNGERYGAYLEDRSYRKNLRLSFYPLLMKYYKDLRNTSIGQLDKIIEEFNKRQESLDSYFAEWRVYDKYALRTIKCYLYNARFDFKLSGAYKCSFGEMIKDLQEIEDLQRETRISDFYPYIKAAFFVSSLLEKREMITESERKVYLETYNNLITKSEDALGLCRAHSFYPIQSRYFDCIVSCDGFGPIFIPSSYCRPLQYEKIEEIIAGLKTRAAFFENAIRLDVERKEIEKIKDKIDQSRKYTIELISAFTAIITFLFGTIDFFAESSSDALVNRVSSILSLGLVLLLFVSSISMVTMRRELSWKLYWKEPRFLFFVVLAVVCLGLLSVLVFYSLR